MTDREMLEYAAKAAGRSGYIYEWVNGPQFITPGENPIAWNPLTDDGDALRLAVKLGLEVYQAHSDGEWGTYAGYSTATDQRIRYMIEPHGSDRYAATRRAIVLAAAEIGKTQGGRDAR